MLQDISDLLEKEAADSVKVLRLESNGLKVIRKDWSQHITEDLRAGTADTLLSLVDYNMELLLKMLIILLCYEIML